MKSDRQLVAIQFIGATILIWLALTLTYVLIVKPIAGIIAENGQLEADLEKSRMEKIEAEARLESVLTERDACMQRISPEEQRQVRGF